MSGRDCLFKTLCCCFRVWKMDSCTCVQSRKHVREHVAAAENERSQREGERKDCGSAISSKQIHISDSGNSCCRLLSVALLNVSQ